MKDVSFSMGSIFFAAAGTMILVSLPFLADGSTTAWNLSRTLYAMGVVLFLIDR